MLFNVYIPLPQHLALTDLEKLEFVFSIIRLSLDQAHKVWFLVVVDRIGKLSNDSIIRPNSFVIDALG